MKYLEKINNKCKECELCESIELDLRFFNLSYLNALNEIFKNKSYHCHEGEKVDSCVLRFDDNNNVYLNFKTDYNNDILVISSSCNYQGLNYSLIIPESYLFCNSFKEFLNINEQEYRSRAITSKEARYEFKHEMGESLDKVCAFLDKYSLDKKSDVISFYSTNDECVGRTPFTAGVSSSNVRKNELIDFGIRCEVLENSKYAYKIEAFDRNKDEVDNNYVVYCYNLPDKKVRFIAEPVSGCKYTKVAYFKDYDLTLDSSRYITKKMLEFSQSDISDIDNITRHRHLEIEQYKRLINYILGKDDGIGLGMKRSIDNAVSSEDNKFVRKK